MSGFAKGKKAAEILRTHIENGNNDEVLVLLDTHIHINNGSFYDISYLYGENLLHWCAGYNNIEICQYLLVNGMNPTIANSRGATPLYYATMKNNMNIVELLLKFGADPCIRSGFSDKLPKDIIESKARDMLIHAERIVSIDGFSLSDIYNYRLYRFYNAILTNCFLHINNRNTIEGVPILLYDKLVLYKKYKNMFESHMTEEEMETNKKLTVREFNFVLIECKKAYEQFIQRDTVNCCLYCKKKDDLLRCSTCKSSYFCDRECQIKSRQLHKFNCNVKLNN
jgi:hypothetical protein